MKLNILLCGLGSIGQYHAKLLREHFDHNLFALRTYKGQKDYNFDLPELRSWEDVDQHEFDIAFITNPTDLHIPYALECASRGMHLFVEKPIGCSIDGLDKLLELVERNSLASYVAYPLRFHPVLRELKALLENKRILHARIICTSYLPDWRPGQNYLKNYSAFKEKGGGVILDLSHEIDYAYYLFGDIKSIGGMQGKLSDVTVDSEDYADVVIFHESVVTSIHLNYFSRNPQRIVEVELGDFYIKADLINNRISFIGKGDRWTKEFTVTKDDIYLLQLNYFLENISNPRMDNNLFEASNLFKKIMGFRNKI